MAVPTFWLKILSLPWCCEPNCVTQCRVTNPTAAVCRLLWGRRIQKHWALFVSPQHSGPASDETGGGGAQRHPPQPRTVCGATDNRLKCHNQSHFAQQFLHFQTKMAAKDADFTPKLLWQPSYWTEAGNTVLALEAPDYIRVILNGIFSVFGTDRTKHFGDFSLNFVKFQRTNYSVFHHFTDDSEKW